MPYLNIITDLFPFLKSTKFWLILIGTILLVLSVAFLYNRYVGMVEEIANLKTANSGLTAQVVERDDQIVRYKADLVTYEAVIHNLNMKSNFVDKERQKLERKLIKDGRDIGFIAYKKPELMEKVVNKAAANRMRCLEVATGSPVKPEEQNLNKSERNNVCAYLFGYTD